MITIPENHPFLCHALPHEKVSLLRWLKEIDNAKDVAVVNAYADACHTLITTIELRINDDEGTINTE